jgi:hypothetical protein
MGSVSPVIRTALEVIKCRLFLLCCFETTFGDSSLLDFVVSCFLEGSSWLPSIWLSSLSSLCPLVVVEVEVPVLLVAACSYLNSNFYDTTLAQSLPDYHIQDNEKTG